MSDAQTYYNGLITQGHTPESATQYTQQYFPGFAPAMEPAPAQAPAIAAPAPAMVATPAMAPAAAPALEMGGHPSMGYTATPMTGQVQPNPMMAGTPAPAMVATPAPAMGAQVMGTPAVVAPMAAQPVVMVQQPMSDDKPSILLAYVLWFFLGWLGIHHIYIGRGIGIWLLSLITFQGFGLWWFIDLFLIPSSCSKIR